MSEQHPDKAESDRILSRVRRETEGGGLLGTRMERGGPAEDDWIEHWGTRIGRAIGMVAAAALLTWIVLYALNLV